MENIKKHNFYFICSILPTHEASYLSQSMRYSVTIV